MRSREFLFKVERADGQVIQICILTKARAKEVRDRYNEVDDRGCHVHRGPEHRLGETGKTKWGRVDDGDWTRRADPDRRVRA